MECSIEELFSENEILNNKEELINIFNKCKEDLNNKRIDFYSLKCSKEYRNLLCRYFKWKGYGYLLIHFENLLNEVNIEDDLNINIKEFVKIAKLLNDSGIIKINKVKFNNEFEKDNLIRYKKNKGMEKKYLIRFKCEDIPFNINNISIQHENIISYYVNNLHLKLKINIEANSEEEYNFTETMLIYTDYEIYKLQFTIKCEYEDIIDMPFKTLDEYINIYKENKDKAYELFINKNFGKYLNQLENKIAWIKYNEALKLSKVLKEDKFNIFLKLNNIYNEEKSNTSISDMNKIHIEVPIDEKEDNKIIGKDEMINNYDIDKDRLEEYVNVIIEPNHVEQEKDFKPIVRDEYNKNIDTENNGKKEKEIDIKDEEKANTSKSFLDKAKLKIKKILKL